MRVVLREVLLIEGGTEGSLEKSREVAEESREQICGRCEERGGGVR